MDLQEPICKKIQNINRTPMNTYQSTNLPIFGVHVHRKHIWRAYNSNSIIRCWKTEHINNTDIRWRITRGILGAKIKNLACIVEQKRRFSGRYLNGNRDCISSWIICHLKKRTKTRKSRNKISMSQGTLLTIE